MKKMILMVAVCVLLSSFVGGAMAISEDPPPLPPDSQTSSTVIVLTADKKTAVVGETVLFTVVVRSANGELLKICFEDTSSAAQEYIACNDLNCQKQFTKTEKVPGLYMFTAYVFSRNNDGETAVAFATPVSVLFLPSTPTCTNQCKFGDRLGTSDIGYKTCVLNPETGCAIWSSEYRCPAGTVFKDGACVALPPAPTHPQIDVGKWEGVYVMYGGKEPTWVSVSVNPAEWDIKDILCRVPESLIVPNGTWKNGEYQCSGFLIELPGPGIISFYISPRTNGFLEIHFEYGDDKRKETWTFEGVSDQMPGAPRKLPIGKLIGTWGDVKSRKE